MSTTPTLSERLEREQVVAAIQKRQAGGTLTAQEVVLVKRHERRLAERQAEAAGLQTRRQLARGLGISERTVTRMVEAGMPVAEKTRGRRGHRFDPLACWRWDRSQLMAEMEADDANGAFAAGGSSPMMERLRRWNARLAELKVLREEKRLVERDEYDQTWRETWGVVRALLEHVIQQCEGTCGSRINEIISDGIADVEHRSPFGLAEAVST